MIRRKFNNENQRPVVVLWLELWAVFFNQSVQESDYERKRKNQLVESMRDSVNTTHQFLDKLDEGLLDDDED
jgi:hypothetical protein